MCTASAERAERAAKVCAFLTISRENCRIFRQRVHVLHAEECAARARAREDHVRGDAAGAGRPAPDGAVGAQLRRRRRFVHRFDYFDRIKSVI